MTKLFALSLIAVLPMKLQAQDVVGHITGLLQGYQSVWFVTSSVEGGQSDWSGDETYALVTILGHTTANTVLETSGALALSFEMISEAGGYNVLGREIAYYRQPEILYLSKPDNAEIQVTSAMFEEGQLHIVGKFAGTLHATDDFGATFDLADSRIVAGSFDAELLILE